MLDWSRYREFNDPLPTRDIVTDSPEETVNALNSAILIALLEQSNEIPKNSTEPFEIKLWPFYRRTETQPVPKQKEMD
ncbi:hypothetical protein TNCT_405861 [Trichonephila clavata]|uniref:Uncharacterized protein n=1 Tax=Trichonephila clavata TaxID=2740835 RepID=A0A8X6JCE8_TRICU|nr:hypothetical protein TNCT_405861 [Trichonephila clavata]